jgi:glutamate racemase
MDSRPVAVIDSGIGGLPYLAWLRDHLPCETLVYVADRKNFPYGEKTPEQVRSAVADLAQRLQTECDPKLLVVACNTASVLALEHLRAVFPGPVVGVVPAVKTSAAMTRNGHIGVLATQRTIDGGYLEHLVQEFCPGKSVATWAAPDLVTLVENDFLQPDAVGRAAVLTSWANIIQSQGADTVVLGCTHFLYVTDELSRLLGTEVVLLDSRDGVGKRVLKLLVEGSLEAQSPGESRLYFTSDRRWNPQELFGHERKFKHFALQFGLSYGGPWSDSF